VLSAAIAVGVISGLLEWGVVSAQLRGLHYVDWTFLMISRHAGWMIPTTEAALIVATALILIGPLLCLTAWRLRRSPDVNLPGPAWDWAGMVLGFLLFYGPLLSVRGFHPLAPLAVSMGLGFRIRRLIVRPTEAWRRRIHGAALIGIGVLGLLVLTQWHKEPAVPRPLTAGTAGPAPNLLWIVLDTLRADRMSVYGYERPTTPELQALAKAGITFDMARSTAPWTLPSHISMFTGLWPSDHGACVDRAYHGDSPTLAEHLRGQGYATAGIVANVRMCNTVYGVGRGFDHYVDYPWRDDVNVKMALKNTALGPVVFGIARRLGIRPPALYPYDYRQPASEITAKGRQWLDSLDRPATNAVADSRPPYFLFLNFTDVHGPYLPLADALGRFWHGPAPTEKDAGPGEGWRAVRVRDAADPARRPELQREVDAIGRRLGDLYDECVVGLDAEIGRFLAGLREAGTLENTWVVITADHGEHFGEHGHFGHGSTLYNEQTHVPLILIPPLGLSGQGGDPFADLRGRRVNVPVSLRDLPATLTGLLLPRSAHPFPGRSLARHWHTEDAEPADPVISQVDEPRLKGEDFQTSDLEWVESVIDDDHVLIESARRSPELFALFDDPKQEHNLAGRPDQERRQEQMKRVLDVLHHRPASGTARR
jgi:arylsulfatase A-like enzyme